MKKKSLKTISGKRVLSVGLALAMTISLFSGAGVSEVQAAENGVTYEHMTIASGLNADVVATQYAAATDEQNSETYQGTAAVDKDGLIEDSGYNCLYSSGVDSEDGCLPENGIITSTNAATPGLSWQLNDYVGDNVLKIVTDEKGTLTFSKLGCYQSVYFLVTAGGLGQQEVTMNATITYTDNTTSNAAFVVYDWYKDSNVATNIYRRYGDGDQTGGSDKSEAAPNGSVNGAPYFTQCVMSVESTKLIKSIALSNETTNMVLCVYAVTGVTADINAPTVSDKTVTVNDTSSFTAKWNEVEAADSYVIDVALDSDFKEMVSSYNNFNVGNVTEYEVKGLTSGQTYYYRVRAVAGNDGQSASSEVVTVNPVIYTVSVNEGEGYKFTYPDSNDVTYNGSYTFTVEAEEGYSLADLYFECTGECEITGPEFVDGNNKCTYTISNIQSNVTCTAADSLGSAKIQAKAEIQATADTAKTAIDALKSVDSSKKNEWKNAIDQIVSDGFSAIESAKGASGIENAKTDAIDKIYNVLIEAIEYLVKSGNTSEAEDLYEILPDDKRNDISDEAKAELDEFLQKAKEEAIESVESTADDTIARVNSLEKVTETQKKAWIDEVNSEKETGISEIKKADTVSAVEEATRTAIENINSFLDIVEGLINDIGDVTYSEESKDKIDAAREAYDKLTDDEKNMIPDELKQKLENAEKKYDELEAEANPELKTAKDAAEEAVEKAADDVSTRIDELTKATDEQKDAWKDKVDDAENKAKDRIDDADTTTEVETAKDAALDEIGDIFVDIVEELIKNIVDDKTYDAAKEAYDKLSDAEKAELSQEAKDRFDEAKNQYDSDTDSELDSAKDTASKEVEDAANAVDKRIDELTNLTEEQKNAYKDIVDSVEEAGKSEIQKAETAEEVEKAKDSVLDNIGNIFVDITEDLIENIGDITYNEVTKEKIDAAKEAYDKLTEEEKKELSAEAKDKLDAAEKEYKELADKDPALQAAKADAVKEIENAATSVNSKIDALTKLTDEQKKTWKQQVETTATTGKNDINEAVTTAKVTEVKTQTVTAMNSIMVEITKKLISEIGEVTNSDASKNKIDAAREAYNSLSDAEKNQIPAEVLKTLTEAETKYSTVSASQNQTTVNDGTLSLAEAESLILNTNTDKKDPAGSSFSKLRLKATGANKAIKLSWTKVKGADGYILYGAKCGNKMEYLKELGAKKKTATIKKLKKGTYYKYIIAAYKLVNGEKRITDISKSAHAVTKGGKYGNPTKVTYKKSTVSLKKGKTLTLKPKMKISKKVKIHIAKFRYESTNTKIATVSKKGKIKAKKKGTCYVYIYAQNGYYKKIKVKVK